MPSSGEVTSHYSMTAYHHVTLLPSCSGGSSGHSAEAHSYAFSFRLQVARSHRTGEVNLEVEAIQSGVATTFPRLPPALPDSANLPGMGAPDHTKTAEPGLG